MRASIYIITSILGYGDLHLEATSLLLLSSFSHFYNPLFPSPHSHFTLFYSISSFSSLTLYRSYSVSVMSMEVQQKRFNSMERRPRMLKDFLNENSNSCSSSGLKSFSRKPNDTNNMQSLIEMELIKSKMKNSSNNYYSPFQTLINTITSISFFTAVKKSPAMNFLPRSLSRKLSSSSRRRNQSFCKGGGSTVKIKDIIRWKSFRDLVEEHHHHQHQPSLSPPLDFHHCMVGSTTTTTTTTTACSSSGSSWCDSDFTSGYLSSWEAQNDNVEASKKFSFSPLVVVGKELVEPATVTAEYTAVVGAKVSNYLVHRILQKILYVCS